VELRVAAAPARGVTPPEGLRVTFHGEEAVATVDASTIPAALQACEAWLAALRARQV
jgi:hypothetical protein